jgi:hypothetical protein
MLAVTALPVLAMTAPSSFVRISFGIGFTFAFLSSAAAAAFLSSAAAAFAFLAFTAAALALFAFTVASASFAAAALLFAAAAAALADLVADADAVAATLFIFGRLILAAAFFASAVA